MQLTKWKSFRLLWTPWFILHLYIYVNLSFFVELPDAIQFIRSFITTTLLTGCLFYSLGIRCFTRFFWQVLFIIASIDELLGWYESSEFDLFNFGVITTFYIVAALYAFQNKKIWGEHHKNGT
ncbi:hypothetical protein [Pseudoalteromonas sp. MMG013]|uniref:hypothetical protein n=1 Tax=Pseudoalteromonas sp. MMG013 TaxID=2822687 RepID=UPI001B38796C|nr:hypothetical protein [Pseudoalteromonas sp. MMG013]